MKTNTLLAALLLSSAAFSARAQAETVTYQIAASEDDTYATSTGGNSYGNSVLYWPWAGADRRGYLRWSIEIPAGAVINSATVQVKAQTATTGTTTMGIQMLDADSSADFTSNPWDSAVTGTVVNWAFPATAVGTWYTSSDIAAIVQAFIDRSGYSEGNYLGLRGVKVSGSSSHKLIYAWNYGTHDSGAKLEISYTPNQPPTAVAGADQLLHDTNLNGTESVTLIGSGSSDTDGTIVSYVWSKSGVQIATGATPTINLAVGQHTITLTVTDNRGATGTDLVSVEVNAPPTADADADQSVTDSDLDGAEEITLNGANSTDADGSIVSWVWKEGSTEIATGEAPSVWLATGVHTLTLTVTDDNGATGTDQVVITVNPGAVQATLTYAYGANGTKNDRPLLITASHLGNTIWTMSVRVPQQGFLQTSHGYNLAGEIISFKDVRFGGTPFEYSPETTSISSPGLLRMGGMQGDFLDGTSASDHSKQTSSYYEFTKTNVITTGVVGKVTVRINAPYVLTGTDHNTSITGAYTVTNTSGATYDLWGTGSTVGTGSLNLAHGGYTTWAFVNPSTSTSKPTLHATDVTNGHQLYSVYDWYGSTATSALPGFFAKQVVKSNSLTSAQNMRQGMTFELRADDMSLFYSDTANIMYGSTSVSTANGVRCALTNQPDSFGGLNLDTGTSITMDWVGTISTLPFTVRPLANAGPDQNLFDTGSNEIETVSLDGSASYDADGSIVSWVWKEGTTVIANGQTAQANLGLGVHVITLTVTDNAGSTDTDTVLVEVKFNGPFYVDQTNPAADDSNFGTATLPWKTLGRATSAAVAGQTVNVKQGVYRESVTLPQSGNTGSPIVFQAVAGQRVVIAGSDILTGWTQLGSTPRNPNYASIYYKDVSWAVGSLYEDEQALDYARTPNTGYWSPAAGSDLTHIVNSNFNQPDSNYWVGARMFYLDKSPVGQWSPLISAYNPATQTVTTSSVIYTNETNPPEVGVDVFYMRNKLEMIDLPGEWACEDLGGGTWRVYLRPSGGGNPSTHTYEAPRRTTVLDTNGKSHISISGFEICHQYTVPFGTILGTGIDVGGGGDITIENCLVRDNGKTGISLTFVDGAIVRDCLMTGNRYGISLGSCTNVLVETNEIAWNAVDGVNISGTTAVNSSAITFRNNYIHDHFLWGHPDGVQTFNSDGSSNAAVRDIWFDSNAVINSGQSFITAELADAHFINNLVSGATSNVMKSNTVGGEFINNTFAMSGYNMMTVSVTQTGITLKNNVFYNGHDNNMMTFADPGMISDYNMYYMGPGIAPGHVVKYLTTYYNDLTSYKNASGKDTNSSYADPLFVNVPAFFDKCDDNKLAQSTTTRVYVVHGTSTYTIGDNIEYSFDGVFREVTGIGADYIEFSPALPESPVTSGLVCNWKSKTNYTYDFGLAASSPAIGTGEGGADIGSSVDLEAYKQGDLDGDGFRNVPEWP